MKSKMVQGSFIEQLNRLPLGELINVQTSDDDIGGELLNILSKERVAELKAGGASRFRAAFFVGG